MDAQKLEQIIVKEWHDIPRSILIRLAGSMKSRCELIIEGNDFKDELSDGIKEVSQGVWGATKKFGQVRYQNRNSGGNGSSNRFHGGLSCCLPWFP
ncbi:hypothetical protein G9A89_020455 [Geosiphon pyriformis]|nr:hypothetical protein G9A89_020455 [Geosiphon pyriformis]